MDEKLKSLPYDDKRSFLFNIREAESRAYKGEIQSSVLYFVDALRSFDDRLKRIEYVIDELGKIIDSNFQSLESTARSEA